MLVYSVAGLLASGSHFAQALVLSQIWHESCASGRLLVALLLVAATHASFTKVFQKKSSSREKKSELVEHELRKWRAFK